MGDVPKTLKSDVCDDHCKELSGTLLNDASGLSEKHLVAAARSGDEAAFDTLFKSHLGAIRAAGSSILGTDDLDDMTQEVSFLAWKGLKTFREESTFRTWVTSIARRRCFALLKQRKAQASTPSVWADEQSSDLMEARFELARLVGGLTPSNKNLIEMNLKGFTDQQIAKEMNLTIRTVRGRRQRAVDSMREKIREASEQIASQRSLMSSNQNSKSELAFTYSGTRPRGVEAQ